MEALMEFGLVIPLGMTPLFANKLFYWSFFDFSWLDRQREDKENKVRFFSAGAEDNSEKHPVFFIIQNHLVRA
jgi:hypothetical protein